MVYKIYFLLSSITYLQYYIPILIQFQKENIKSIFLYRKNIKKYADPFNKSNLLILNKFCEKYDIKLLKSSNFNFKDTIGIFIMVDGDILGPGKKKYIKDSILFKLNSKSIKISLQENLNFLWNYDSYINHVDVSVFPNKHYASLYNKLSKKNIYLGNTKYDNHNNNFDIFKKFNLNKNINYVIFFFPKKKFIDCYDIKEDDILNIYNHLYKLNYKIIVKTRPKDNIINKKLKGNIFINEEMLFPNISIDLLKISKLCILFSSSAVEETIKCKIPTIDLHVDTIDNIKRLEFLYHEKTIQHIKNWKNINFNKFKNIHDKLCKKNDIIFDKIIDTYLFRGNISIKILKYIYEKYPIKEINNINDLKSIFNLNISNFDKKYFIFIKEIYNLYLKRNPYNNEYFKYIKYIKKNIFDENIFINNVKNLIDH
jgi:hypothetical protein